MNSNNPSQLPTAILSEIITALNEVTDMWRNAPSQFRGDALKNFRDKVLTPELDKLEERLPGYAVYWSQEYRKFGIFTK